MATSFLWGPRCLPLVNSFKNLSLLLFPAFSHVTGGKVAEDRALALGSTAVVVVTYGQHGLRVAGAVQARYDFSSDVYYLSIGIGRQSSQVAGRG